jgi:thiol-disulfide isomerase/thioredoxin
MRISFLTFAFFLFASGACLGADVVQPKETTESPSNGFVGQSVAAFNALTAAGVSLSSESHGAKALIITLWGLSCASCLDEMKALEPLYQEFRDRGLKIWAVNTEDIDAREIEKGLRIRELS